MRGYLQFALANQDVGQGMSTDERTLQQATLLFYLLQDTLSGYVIQTLFRHAT